jgi:hypothetical protein
MAKKNHKSVEMTSEEDGVEVIEAGGRARARTVAGRVLEEIGGEGHEFDELESESGSDSDSDSDAFEELDAEFEELDEDDEREDVVDEDAIDVIGDDAVDVIGDDEDDVVDDEEGVVGKAVEADEGVGGGDSDDMDDDALIEDDASGWLPDPDNAEQERFWDGTEWTDQVRAVEEQDLRGRQHLPDHVPELQRALAAATADIDDVEARLSTLFDRGKRAGAAPTAAAPAAAAGPPIHEEFGGGGGRDASSDDRAHPKYMGEEGVGEASGDDDEATFAELDAALVAETPEKPDRRFFKRRS